MRDKLPIQHAPIRLSLSDDPGVRAAPDAWSDPFLALGDRLRMIYGSQVTLDEGAPAYRVNMRKARVALTTLPKGDEGTRVSIRCKVRIVPRRDDALLAYAMRMNAELALARLVLRDGGLVAEYEVPFNAAHGRLLQAGIKHVAIAADAAAAEFCRSLAG